MKHIQIKTEDRIANIFLDRGKSNAMDTVLLEELNACIHDLKSDVAIEGVIIHGKEGFFSAGLDLITLYEYNETEIRDFWSLFSKQHVIWLRFQNQLYPQFPAIALQEDVLSQSVVIIGSWQKEILLSA